MSISEALAADETYIKNLILYPTQRVCCIYHSADHDGQLSADLLKTTFSNIWYIGTNYGKAVNYSQIQPGSVVFIVDFALPPDDIRMLMRYNTIVYIDHHETCFTEEYQEFKNLEGIRSRQCAACRLVWEYLHPGIDCPDAVRMISDYDTWNFSDPNTNFFNYGLSLYNLNPRQCSEMFLSRILNDNSFRQRIINMGKRISAYVDKKNCLLSKYGSFISELNGNKVLCMNIRNTNSMVLDDAAKANPSIRLRSTFGYNSSIDKYKCSLYSDEKDIVVQNVDNRFNGHKGAAGMECTFSELPYALPTPTKNPPEEEDYVSQIEKMQDTDPLLWRFDASSLGYLCKLCGYESKIDNYSVYAVNHPFWTNFAIYNTNLITEYDLVIFWSLTSSGWYRYRIYPLEKSVLTLDIIKNTIKDSKIVGNSVWCYRKTPPEEVASKPPEQT